MGFSIHMDFRSIGFCFMKFLRDFSREFIDLMGCNVFFCKGKFNGEIRTIQRAIYWDSMERTCESSNTLW